MQCFYRPVGLVSALGLATVISTCVTTALLLGDLPVATPASLHPRILPHIDTAGINKRTSKRQFAKFLNVDYF